MSERSWTRTTCPYCGVGCGVMARARDDGTAEIMGDPDHPANFGRLCSKGSALGETVSLDGRLLEPRINGRRASWDDALDLVAQRFAETAAVYGPDSVAMYVSGQILTEDYYVANKFMKGFVGTSNIDTNSRLCMASSVAGHKRAFGSDTVPGTYEDLEIADLVVLVGSNLAWCHPVLYQRLAAAREAHGTRVVVVDPRQTATCEIADLHLRVAPGSDVALFNGLLAHLCDAGKFDRTYIAAHTTGLDGALAAARGLAPAEIARITGISPAQLAEFYALFAATERVVTVYSQGVNQSTAGTDKVNAIINCHLATGRIGRSGMGPFSVTGQPNAMGGRETGGLANMLAAHMDLDNPQHREIVGTFWGAPRLASAPGLKAVDLFKAVADGRIKALWIMATNPVVSMPEADAVRSALSRVPFLVVSDVNENTDTTAHAHVLLPASAWGEKDGTVTNSERRISRQRRFMEAPVETRPDWWQVAQVAQRMGFAAAFDYAHPAHIFKEYAALTGAGNNGARDLDISAYGDLSEQDYDELKPFHWPRRGGLSHSPTRFFAAGGFFTPDRKARLVAASYRAPALACDASRPLTLNTGRVRDQWHTMTRTAKTSRLMSHIAEPFLEIHPDDARRHGLEPAVIAEVESDYGRALLRVCVTERQRPGSVFAPMHWTDQLARGARICAVIAANVDPVSGQPELKGTPVAVRPFKAAWYGFLVSLTRPDAPPAAYHATAPAGQGYRCELAGGGEPASWEKLARGMLAPAIADGGDLVVYSDAASRQHRFGVFADDRLVAALFLSPDPVAVSRTYTVEQLGVSVEPDARLAILAGRPGPGVKERGRIVCACFSVGELEIAAAAAEGCRTVAAIGERLNAGTNCGSCRAEIGALLHRYPERQPADAIPDVAQRNATLAPMPGE
ncbi:MAG: molybdopterin-dependent oxidoreductase [Hyphomicrobiaceae bacterium]